MSTTVFTAPQYDPRRERGKRIIVAALLAAVVIIGILAYLYRNWPEERSVDHFFSALVNKDFEGAYGIWQHDPKWKQHPQDYPKYAFHDFYNDWGPGGEWGIIKSYHIDGSANTKEGGSGVVVVVTINERKVAARIWVEKKDKTLSFSPY